MSGAAVVRLFYCRPLLPAFDPVLRDVLVSGLRSNPDVADVWAARQGPDEMGLRLVVSLWSSMEAMRHVMGEDLAHPRFDPEHLPEITEPRLEVFGVLLEFARAEAPSTGVLRVSRGVLRDDDVLGYAERVGARLEDSRQDGPSPHSLVFASAGGRAFVTVSTWPDWKTIEVATGASISDPIRTKGRADLASFHAEHYELLPT